MLLGYQEFLIFEIDGHNFIKSTSFYKVTNIIEICTLRMSVRSLINLDKVTTGAKGRSVRIPCRFIISHNDKDT